MAKPDPETRLEPDTDRTKPRAQRPGSLKSPDLSEKTNPGPNPLARTQQTEVAPI